ncbi:MAG TPA: hypothetical protein VM759_09250 [Longimicrobium sp.]|nr:hypothetical protein [Longimicrobium sp.]
MILEILATGAAAGAVGLVVVWLRTRRAQRSAAIGEVSAWLARMLWVHDRGSVLIAEPNGRSGFIQFALTGRLAEWRCIEFGLPETDWSRSYFAAVHDALGRADIRTTIEAGDGNGLVERFLSAEISGGREEVLRAASDMIPRIAAALGHPERQTYRISLEGGESPEYREEIAARLEATPARGLLERKFLDWLARTNRPPS